MKITSNKPDENQSYKNNFKENGVYPFSKITRVITDKNSGEILSLLNENDSEFLIVLKESFFDPKKHDIMCMFPKFYYRRFWEDEDLEDSLTTEIPPVHIQLIPNEISDKGFEVFPCFVREDGSIRDYVLYSAFEGSIVDGQLRSIPNEEVVVNKTLEEFRGFARSDRDERFNLENMSVIAMIQFLYKIGFQDLNSQKVLGKGWVKKQSKTKTGGTLKLGNRSGYLDPFANSPDKPDDRISLSFRAGENGELAMYNAKSSDPMPIKTINMAGLQKWEETEDYIIYLDKDAIMTTVANYVTGTYDLFKERKADIDGAMELLKINNIEWTSEDDSKLILDINKAQLERIANTPTTMEEEDFTPQTFTTRAVPTTYEACFRVDKSSGEIYIGEGYENLGSTSATTNSAGNGKFEVIGTENGYSYKILSNGIFALRFNFKVNLLQDDIVCCTIKDVNKSIKTLQSGHSSLGNIEKEELFAKLSLIGSPASTYAFDVSTQEFFEGENVEVKNIQITKTSTPKPFVKSIMPSGKLAFVTNATSETHSFIGKNFIKSSMSDYAGFYQLGKNTVAVERVFSSLATVNGALYSYTISKKYQGCKNETSGLYNLASLTSNNSTEGFIDVGRKNYLQASSESFTQLLIYKANLTEAELKAENEKDIIGDNQVDNNEYPPQYNSNSLFGIENFYGNVKRITDGFIAKDDGYYHTSHPNKMGQTSAYEHLPSQVITGGSNGVEGLSKKIDKNLGVFNIPSELNEQKNVLAPVTRGLIEWFDFADGKGTEATLKSRVSDNVLILTNFNFDANSGWTGKGLKFDGVDDWCKLDKSFEQLCEISIPITLEISLTYLGSETGVVYTNSLGDNRGADYSIKNTAEGVEDSFAWQSTGVSKKGVHFTLKRKKDEGDLYTQHFAFSNGEESLKIVQTSETEYHGDRYAKQKWSCFGARFNNTYSVIQFAKIQINSIKIYNVALTEEEIAQNYEYEQSIDRTTVSTYPLLQEQKSYGIGLSNQLSEEQKSTFRLSVDGTKFVAGLRYCEGLEVEEFTYSEIQVEMEKEEWSKIEELEEETKNIEQNTEIQSSIEEYRLTSKSNTKTSEETHYTDYFISHAPNKENIAIFGSDFEAEEKAGVFTLDLNKEINHKDDRTSARLVILP